MIEVILINSLRLSRSLSHLSPSSLLGQQKQHSSCLCITSRVEDKLDYQRVFKNSAAKWHVSRN